MATNLIEYARDGFFSRLENTTNPHMYSSACWYAWEAGRALDHSGRTKPVKATMGRGYSVNLKTAANEFKAIFHGSQSFTTVTIERVNR